MIYRENILFKKTKKKFLNHVIHYNFYHNCSPNGQWMMKKKKRNLSKNGNQSFIIDHEIIEAKIQWKQNDLKINK